MEQLEDISLEAILTNVWKRLHGALICPKSQDVIKTTQ